MECDKKFNLTSGLEIAGHEVSPQSHLAELGLNRVGVISGKGRVSPRGRVGVGGG